MHHFSVTRTSLALGPVVLAAILAGLVGLLSVARADWPMVRKDAQNSAATSVVSFNLPFVEEWEEPANGSVTRCLAMARCLCGRRPETQSQRMNYLTVPHDPGGLFRPDHIPHRG